VALFSIPAYRPDLSASGSPTGLTLRHAIAPISIRVRDAAPGDPRVLVEAGEKLGQRGHSQRERLELHDRMIEIKKSGSSGRSGRPLTSR
jgi:hypothetical protein